MNHLNLKAGYDLFNKIKEGFIPLTFTYDDIAYTDSSNLKKTEELIEDASFISLNQKYLIKDDVYLILKTKYNKEFGEVEYIYSFINNSSSISKVLKNVNCLNISFDSIKAKVNGILGDHDNFYKPYRVDLEKEFIFHQENYTGRATHITFPYYNLSLDNGGYIYSLGWAGTWTNTFTYEPGKVDVVSKTNCFLQTVIKPEEEIYGALVVILPYKGSNDQDVMNLWRKWFLKYNTPKEKDGSMLKPFSTTHWSYDTGIPNADGSISERYYTWKPTLDKILKENLKFEYRWIDAGWYISPDGYSPKTEWWETVGTWVADPNKWPDDTFKEQVLECKKNGIKTLVWFEPERVTHVDDLVKNYGYKKEWAFSNGALCYLNNIGDDECLNWTLNRILTMMEKNDVDLYREDYNYDPGNNYFWGGIDIYYKDELNGLSRYGMGENKCVMGHYKMWDAIVKWQTSHDKATFVDNCSSGGGRLDIRSLRLSVPLMRSDYDRTTVSMRLSMTQSFNKWIPFHGSCSKETENQNEVVREGRGNDEYVNRASFLPIYNCNEAYVRNKDLDYDMVRKNAFEWRKYNKFLLKDIYTLTPYLSYMNKYDIRVLSYNDKESKESIILSFREKCSMKDSVVVKVPYVNVKKEYNVFDVDENKNYTVSGSTLKKGFKITHESKRTSKIFELKEL